MFKQGPGVALLRHLVAIINFIAGPFIKALVTGKVFCLQTALVVELQNCRIEFMQLAHLFEGLWPSKRPDLDYI